MALNVRSPDVTSQLKYKIDYLSAPSYPWSSCKGWKVGTSSRCFLDSSMWGTLIGPPGLSRIEVFRRNLLLSFLPKGPCISGGQLPAANLLRCGCATPSFPTLQRLSVRCNGDTAPCHEDHRSAFIHSAVMFNESASKH